MKLDRKLNIAVGMSGGVDSTLTAYLLKKEGYNIVGIFMKIWDESFNIPIVSDKSGCYGPREKENIESARKIAEGIGVPFYVIDLSKEYKEIVLKYFRQEYLSGKTPNPCIVCNRDIKFGLLLKKVFEAGINFDKFATGHYAKIEFDPSVKRYILKKAADHKKDQSYFLYQLKQDQLEKIYFPLGESIKEDIKKLALKIGFKNLVEKPESQDFYAGDYSDFFDSSENKPGDIINSEGEILGEHTGIINYTIGQRKGLNLGGLEEPLYVIAIDSCKNQIVAGKKEELYTKSFVVDNLNWIPMDHLEKTIKVSVRTRVHSAFHSCSVTPIDSDEIKVVFDEPQMSVTPGQSAVFYDGEIVMGGGTIKNVLD